MAAGKQGNGGVGAGDVNRLCASCLRECRHEARCVVVSCPLYSAVPRHGQPPAVGTRLRVRA